MFLVSFLAFTVSGLCIAFVCALGRRIQRCPTGKDIGVEKLDVLAQQIQSGARAFLMEEYFQMGKCVAFIAVALGILMAQYPVVSSSDALWSAIIFVFGASLSAFAGWAGMSVATEANVRTTVACARGSLNEGLQVAFTAGSVMGFNVVAFGLAGLTLSFVALRVRGGSDAQTLQLLSSFGFGASTTALFARVAGGIYTKAADVAADLVGKVEADIDEDDPHNPAVIADNVGDNVGDVAGMGADLFESYVGSIIAAGALGSHSPAKVAYPFVLSSVGALCSMVGFCFVSTKERGNGWNVHLGSLMWAMERGIYFSAVAFAIVAYLITYTFFESAEAWRIYACVVLGLATGVFIGKVTEFFTSFDHSPVISITEQAATGPATAVIQGLGVGMLSTVPCTIILGACILLCAELCGGYGIAMASVGMLATVGITLASDAYGPVADNAGGLAELAGLDSSVRQRTDSLDALGNTTAAVGKGFAIGSAVLTSLSLLVAFKQQIEPLPKGLSLGVHDPVVLTGMLLGTMMPFLFGALTMISVGKAAGSIITEVRRQFKEVRNAKGFTLMSAIKKASRGEVISPDEDVIPESDRCVALATRAAISEMFAPAMFAILAPLVIGFLVGPRCLLGAISGSIVSGCMLAITMSNAGGAWDNSKKLCEKLGIKKGPVGKACIVADTVGDPFKDTSGPALNILIKLMAEVSLAVSPMLRSRGDWETWRVGVLLASIMIATTCVLIAKRMLSWGDNANLKTSLHPKEVTIVGVDPEAMGA